MKHSIKNLSETAFIWLANAVTEARHDFPDLSGWSDHDWNVIKTISTIHGMGPLWGDAIRSDRCPQVIPEPLQNYFLRQLEENRKRVERIFKTYQQISENLVANKINFIALKGIRLAKEFYPAESLRPMADLDIYVGAGQLERVNSILVDLGYVIQKSDPKGATLYPQQQWQQMVESDPEATWHGLTIVSDKPEWYDGENESNPISIDTHSYVRMSDHFSTYDLTRLFENARVSGAAKVANEVLFIHIAVHCANNLLASYGRWVQLYDLYLLCTRANLDNRVVIELGRELGVLHLLYLPLVLLRKTFKLPETELELALGKCVGRRFKWLSQRAELSEMSCCNPWGTNVLLTLLWTKNFRNLVTGVTREITKEKKEIVNTTSGNSDSVLQRLTRIIKSNLRQQPRLVWRGLELKGVNPNSHWK